MKMTREERWLEIIKKTSGGQRERKWSGGGQIWERW